jgi:phage baseplate assembly protein W|tara:strand:- start:550 stop:945 length:396 start_codon:yes stop_codon:yes gene_type:complete
LANEVPVGITIPYSRGEGDGFFAQTYSMLERARTNLAFLLMTAKGERPMMPTYGSDLRALLFNPNTPDYVDELFEDAVKDAAETWMSEVNILSVVTTRDLENNPYVATLNITFSLSNIPDSEQELEIKVEV